MHRLAVSGVPAGRLVGSANVILRSRVRPAYTPAAVRPIRTTTPARGKSMTTTNAYAPPRAVVDDVAVAGAIGDPADRGTRLGANILDGIIFVAMAYLPLLLTVFAAEEDGGEVLAMIGAGLTLVGFIVWCWLTIKYVQANGQSIAKKLMNIKVVRSDGTRASLGRIFWRRNVVNTVLSIIPLYQLLDALFIFGETRQCLHDKLADTIVVKA
jgi:uncharacterized RDD family membrane protein YckC